MNPGVGRVLYESIIEKKWIDISYINCDGSESRFWVAIYDIPDRENHILSCRMVNYKAGYEEVKTVNNLKADKIVSVRINARYIVNCY